MIRSKLAIGFVFCVSAPVFAQQTAPNAASPPVAASQTAPAPHTLLDGTPVKLRLAQTISSADAKVGQEVPFEVVDEVRVDDVVVLTKGGTAIATVTDAMPKRRMGRGGKLDMSISYARLVDGEKLALRAVKESKGGSHTGAMTGAIVATSLIVWPAAPFFLFMHGKDISIPAGTEVTAFIEGDMRLDMARFGAVAGAPLAVAGAPADRASLSVDSSPPGADIEVDGNYVGSTPSTVSVTPGNHEISVKKKGFAAWSRKMNVTGGTVRVNAELERASGATQ